MSAGTSTSTYQGAVRIARLQRDLPDRPRRRFRPLLFVALVVISLAAIYHFGFFSIERRIFRIDKVHISAEQPLDEAQVAAVLPILRGKGLLTIESSSLAARLLEHPWIENVVVKKEFPAGIRIAVRSKKPAAVRILDGAMEYIDARGKPIDRVSANVLSRLDLPILTFDDVYVKAQWEMEEVAELIHAFTESLGKRHSISEIALGDFPYFRVLLSSRPMELHFSYDTWREQLPNLLLLLDHPLEETRQAQRINLVLPKKAVVSPILSK